MRIFLIACALCFAGTISADDLGKPTSEDSEIARGGGHRGGGGGHRGGGHRGGGHRGGHGGHRWHGGHGGHRWHGGHHWHGDRHWHGGHWNGHRGWYNWHHWNGWRPWAYGLAGAGAGYAARGWYWNGLGDNPGYYYDPNYYWSVESAPTIPYDSSIPVDITPVDSSSSSTPVQIQITPGTRSQ